MIKKKGNLRLIFFLCVATFFDGYDFMAITQILPNLRSDMGINEFEVGILISFINVGALISFFLIRTSDKIGRKRLLNITIIGYTLSTALTGFAPDIYWFALFQFLGRIFLVAETAIAFVYAAEEFPAEKRAFAIGLIQGSLSLGMIFCAAVVPILINTEFGWRSVYYVGILPLFLVAIIRRTLDESKRFVEKDLVEERIELKTAWDSPYKKRIIKMGLIWLFTFFCTQSAFMFWKEFAVHERNFSDGDVGLAVSLASLISLPFIFFTGKFIDWVGRKKATVVIFLIEIFAVYACYSFYEFIPLTISLIFGVFGISAVLIVINTYTTELFPTKIRSSAFAWSNNIIGRIGFIISPVLVGSLAKSIGWGFSVKITAIGLVIALIMILTLLPETNKKELEETSLLKDY